MLFEGHRGGHEQEVGVEGAGDDRADGKRTEREVGTVERDDDGLRHAAILSGIGKRLLRADPGDEIDGRPTRPTRGRGLGGDGVARHGRHRGRHRVAATRRGRSHLRGTRRSDRARARTRRPGARAAA